MQRGPDQLRSSFAGRPLVEDPRHGRVDGGTSFRTYAAELRNWLAAQHGVEPVAVTATPSRVVEEVSVRLAGEHPELPVVVAADLVPDGRVEAVRVYHSLWPLKGEHEVRAPLLAQDPTVVLTGAVADYQRALAAGDADGVVAAFEHDGLAREPAGGPYTYRGSAHRAIYGTLFASGGGIGLQFCTVTDDGTRCAIEYNCVRWGRHEISPQAGLAVYERGRSGRLAAARIYDDVEPPTASDSSL